jgi:hypothetical protein
MEEARAQLLISDGWKTACETSGMSHDDCKTVLLERVKVANFVTPFESHDGLQHLSLATIDNLHHFQRFLSDRNCLNDQASNSLRHYLSTIFSPPMTHFWQGPYWGVWRDVHNALVPCDTLPWVDGKWHIQPMWGHPFKETSLARCPGEIIETQLSTCPMTAGLQFQCTVNWSLRCAEFWSAGPQITPTSPAQCLVYSFGIANEWDFEDNSAREMNCEVHAFDPAADNLQAHLAHSEPNVYFHHLGLSGDGDVKPAAMKSNQVYGEYSGELMPLDDIMSSLGHTNRTIDVLKIDCEGCEWAALNDIATRSPFLLENVCNIYMEVHISTTLGMNSIDQIRLMGKFYSEYIKKHGFRLWYRHTSAGHVHDRDLHPLLREMGFSPNVCCYEIGLYQPKCLEKNSVKHVPEETCVSSSSHAADSSHETTMKDSTLPRQMQKKYDLFDQLAGLASFVEKHQLIVRSNLTIAISQMEGYIHSEVIAPFVDVLRDAGFSHIIVYNDAFVDSSLPTDERVLRHDSILHMCEGWREWDIRKTERCFQETHEWDYLLVLTSSDVYRYAPRHVIDAIKSHKNRVVAIHHHSVWRVKDLFPRYFYLTPRSGRAKFIFPFLRVVPDMPEGRQYSSGYDQLPDIAFGRCLAIIGSTGMRHQEGVEFKKSKDIMDVEAFLSNNTNNIVINVARYETQNFAALVERFPHQCGLFPDVTMPYLHVILSGRLQYIWLPVPQDSLYLDGSFSAALALAFAFKKILVMPRALSRMYGFDNGTVVEYENSVVEIDFDAIDKVAILRRMSSWERVQRIENVLTFYRSMTQPEY